MNIYAATALAMMLSSATLAQDDSSPSADTHNTLPFSDSQISTLFNRGYQIFGGEIGIIRIASRDAPERIYFAKIGDYVGSYRIDRVEGTGDHSVVYLVRPNETVEVLSFTPSKPEQQKAEQGVAPYAAQGAASGER